ncbi:acyl-CoA thioesterase [Martelella endophytica]|uniref:Acyl-CoA hydrolase n=1 Tax=Martelella endophytica TaxID=1486262 RepID=A0A0D5LSN2_MAREN|nr:acyl-CoA thioesterase [Martelella endophytica]AJY46955.1 acyl-CoA hydrolase [Martelella endophytica]
MTANDTPTGTLTMRTVAMPANANPAGDIFGGWVMSQMDLAAFVAASERARMRTVTAAVNSMAFEKPVKIGDTLCVYTTFQRVGRTSMTLHVEAWVHRHDMPAREKVTEAEFVMVAMDDDGRPAPVPQEAV